MDGFDDVKLSYCRCTLRGGFIDTFYNHFLRSHPNVAPLFSDTDMAAQKALLRQGLAMMIQFPHGSRMARNALDRIAGTHGQGGMRIAPHMYVYWLESLVAAVRDHDPEFSPELEKRWRQVMQHGIDHIVAGGRRA